MVSQAISLLNEGFDLSLSNGEFKKDSGWKHLLSPSYRRSEIQKIIEYALQSPDKETTLGLGDALIQRYRSDKSAKKIIQAFDRQIAPLRPQLQYLHPANQKSLSKWETAGQPAEIFRDFPQFAHFLESSLLLSQIKVTRDTVQLVDGEAALFVEGEWVKESDLCRRFEIVDSKLFDSRFVVEKETREVYSYLDNGKGLQKHHPFYTTTTPISILDGEDYAKTWGKASSFIRPEEKMLTEAERAEKNQERPFILQYVTSNIVQGNSNLHDLIINPRHPYLRLIVGVDNPELGTKKGEVFEVGYGWKQVPLLPFMASKGRFRSPDPWEYKTVDERIVTNIPISQNEAHRFYEFTLKYHRDGVNLGIEPGFSLSRQNCSVYSSSACKAAGIAVPTEIDFRDALKRISPDALRKIGLQMHAWAKAASQWIRKEAGRFLPESLLSSLSFFSQKLNALAHKLRDIATAIFLAPPHAVLGGAFGEGGVAFRQSDEPPATIEPPLRNWRNFFDLSAYVINLPGIAQEWQLQQPSTVVYGNRPVRLTIVPT